MRKLHFSWKLKNITKYMKGKPYSRQTRNKEINIVMAKNKLENCIQMTKLNLK